MPSQGKKTQPWVRDSIQYKRVQNIASPDNEPEQQPLNAGTHSSGASPGDDAEFYNPRGKLLAQRLRRLAYTVIVVSTNLMSLFLGLMAGRWSMDLDRTCAAYTTQYCKYRVQYNNALGSANRTAAPVLKKVDVRYTDHAFNGSFIKEEIYRLQGSPEVDAAWEALGVDCECHRRGFSFLMLTPMTDRAGIISYEEGLRSGLTDAHVQRSDEFGGGFFVNVEGMHHLHCLVCTSELMTDGR